MKGKKEKRHGLVLIELLALDNKDIDILHGIHSLTDLPLLAFETLLVLKPHRWHSPIIVKSSLLPKPF
jgi:hypothetical protein